MSPPPCYTCGTGITDALYLFNPNTEAQAAHQLKRDAWTAGTKEHGWAFYKMDNRHIALPDYYYYRKGGSPFCHRCAEKYYDIPAMREKNCQGCGRFIYGYHPKPYCAPRCESKASYERNKKQPVPIQCLRCQETFTPKRTDTKYCSTKCRVAAHRSNG